MLLPALCLMKIVGESISHSYEACYCLYHGIVFFFIASASFSPGVIWMCPLGQQQREKGERHTGSLTVSC